MDDRNGKFSYRRKVEEEEIFAEIMQLMKGEKEPFAFQNKSALPAKLKNLVALGSAIASQRKPKVIRACVKNCLKTEATKQNIREVLQKAILMAEVPVEIYANLVNNMIEEYESNN